MASNGIDFVIGGKDQASPVMSSVEKSLGRMERKTDSLGQSTASLTKMTGALAVAYGAVKAGMALVGGIDAVNDAYDTQTKAVRDLNNALELQGANVGAESARLQQFAADMQDLTGIGDEVTMGLIKQAQTMGVATDQLDDMARAGIGLGEAFGTSAEGGMEMMRQAQLRNFDAFEAMFPQMRYMRSHNEKMAFATELAAKGLQQQADAANSVEGMSGRASGALGDLMEMVGSLLAPVRILISAGLMTLAESLQTVLAPASEYATGVLENIGPMVEWVQGKVVEGVNLMVKAFTFYEVVLTNLDSAWQIVASQAELYMLQISGVIEHALTVQIPAYVSWFGENFVNLMSDAVSLAATAYINHVAKIVDASVALWDFLASGGKSDILGELGKISGRSYLEGFESSLTSLPDIAVRKLTEREKELKDTVGELGAKLGEEFARRVEDRMVTIDKFTEEEAADLSGKIDVKFDQKNLAQQTVQATQGRLLTRGAGTSVVDLLREILAESKDMPKKKDRAGNVIALDDSSRGILGTIAENTSKSLQMERVV